MEIEKDIECISTIANTKNTKEKIKILAQIPNAKDISDILLGGASVRYDGHRKLNLKTRFFEDVKLLQMTIDNSTKNTIVKPVTLRKGNNTVYFYAPRLAIVNPRLFESVFRQKKTRSNEQERSHIYGGKLYCSGCGSKLYGKLEGGRVYYQCNNARRLGLGDNSEIIQCEMKTRLNEAEIDKFIAKEIAPHISLSSNHPDYERLVMTFAESEKRSIRDLIRTEKGHVTRMEHELQSLETKTDTINKMNYLDELRETITEKQKMIIQNQERIEEIEAMRHEDIDMIFACMCDYSGLEKEVRLLIANLIIERIELSEIRIPEHRYQSLNQRGKSEQYQKQITKLQLRPYWHELFLLNRYYNYHNGE